MATEIRANARVQVTLELDGGGPWGPECTAAQIQKQAAEHAISEVERMVNQDGSRASIVGAPQVLMVLAAEKK